MTVSVSGNDLALYLDMWDEGTSAPTAEFRPQRATYILARASALCSSVVTPLPDGAEAVVLDVASRGYVNPTNVTQDTTGPSSVGFGRGGGGLYLTRENKRTLRRLAGGGGAFTFDVMPATAGDGLPPWDIAGVDGFFDWDRPV